MTTGHLFIEEEWPGQDGGKEGAQAKCEVESVQIGPRVPTSPDAEQ